MAVNLRVFRFVLVLVPIISFILLVPASREDPLSVQAPVVYAVEGNTLTLVCIVQDIALIASQFSWKHRGKWLHTQTVRVDKKIKLILGKVERQDAGVYQCGVYNLTGQIKGKPIPKEQNVTLLVGGPINKPKCISATDWPPKPILLWNAIDHYEASRFTYSAFYCSPPSLKNWFCQKPPLGYNRTRTCTNLSVSTGSSSSNGVLECNVTSIFKRLFPDLYDPHAQSPGGSTVAFSVNLENVFSERYSGAGQCNMKTESVQCTRPKDIHIVLHEKQALTLVWDAPGDMGYFTRSLYYIIKYAREGDKANQTIDFSNWRTSKELREVANISVNITGLEPYSVYYVYITCALKDTFSELSRGDFIGPFSARTLEEEPSGKPELLDNWNYTVSGQLRNVTVQWELPDKKTWNGIIQYFVIEYWKTNRSSSDMNNSHVIVLSNVSMTTGDVTNLDVHEFYTVKVRMCTLTGCGPSSEERLIEELEYEVPLSSTMPRNETQRTMTLGIGLSVALLLCLVCALIAAYLWLKRSRRKRLQSKKTPLSERIGDLSPPICYDLPDEPSMAENSGQYDQTSTPLLSVRGKDPGEYVAIKKPELHPSTQAKTEPQQDGI